MNKGDKIREYLTKSNLTQAQIAKKVKCSRAYVTTVKQALQAEDDKEVRPRVVGRGKIKRVDAATAKQMKEASKIDKLLDERGANYGKFIDHATVTQLLKNVMMTHLMVRGKTLIVDQQEALEMILHKIGRILNGNPDYVDSWRDIAGYAQLVADRLEGNVR